MHQFPMRAAKTVTCRATLFSITRARHVWFKGNRASLRQGRAALLVRLLCQEPSSRFRLRCALDSTGGRNTCAESFSRSHWSSRTKQQPSKAGIDSGEPPGVDSRNSSSAPSSCQVCRKYCLCRYLESSRYGDYRYAGSPACASMLASAGISVRCG
ncbi:MAG: hypothetical protein ACI8PT_002478 [Gammaproteobacteria bacterium]|jgi:hypothetical protein